MNNEIILLRRYARQARICIINKLIREAKRLQVNRGNEKNVEKKKNKAEKYLREVLALKHIKDDELSKFGIIHLDNLQCILQNSETDDRTRAMVKVVRYKCLNTKIMEFLKNFPNSKEYISYNNKKHSSKKKKKDFTDELEENLKQVPNKIYDLNSELIMKGMVRTEISLEQLEEYGKDTQCDVNSNEANGKNSKTITKVVSKEATVKRFTDILQESSLSRMNDECQENNKKQFSPILITTTRDDFFLNFNKVVSDINAPISPEGKGFNTKGKKSLLIFQERNMKEMFSKNKRKRRERNEKEQDRNNKDVSYHQHSVKKKTTIPQKQKKEEVSKMKKLSGHRNFEHIKFSKNENENENENENLHPSWAAKKKLQNIMKEGFQGKKIRFEEN